MNCADMILDSVSVANLDEVNLSDMVASGVNIPKFTWLHLEPPEVVLVLLPPAPPGHALVTPHCAHLLRHQAAARLLHQAKAQQISGVK